MYYFRIEIGKYNYVEFERLEVRELYPAQDDLKCSMKTWKRMIEKAPRRYVYDIICSMEKEAIKNSCVVRVMLIEKDVKEKWKWTFKTLQEWSMSLEELEEEVTGNVEH